MSAPVDAENTICERSDLPQAWCGHCKVPDEWNRQFAAEKRARERKPSKPLLGKPFVASFPGECARCETPFEAGDRIRTDYPGLGYISMVCCPNARALKEPA